MPAFPLWYVSVCLYALHINSATRGGRHSRRRLQQEKRYAFFHLSFLVFGVLLNGAILKAGAGVGGAAALGTPGWCPSPGGL